MERSIQDYIEAVVDGKLGNIARALNSKLSSMEASLVFLIENANLGGDNGLITLVPSGGMVTIDCTAGSNFILTTNTPVTSISIIPPVVEPGTVASFSLMVAQGVHNSRLVWPSEVNWSGGLVPILSSDVGIKSQFMFTTHDQAQTWLGNMTEGGYVYY